MTLSLPQVEPPPAGPEGVRHVREMGVTAHTWENPGPWERGRPARGDLETPPARGRRAARGDLETPPPLGARASRPRRPGDPLARGGRASRPRRPGDPPARGRCPARGDLETPRPGAGGRPARGDRGNPHPWEGGRPARGDLETPPARGRRASRPRRLEEPSLRGATRRCTGMGKPGFPVYPTRGRRRGPRPAGRPRRRCSAPRPPAGRGWRARWRG